MNIFLEGLILGFAYVIPIGAQNSFVIQSAITHGIPRSFLTSFFVSLMDISLGLTCFFGVGIFINDNALLKKIFLLAGAAFLLYTGFNLIRSKINSIDSNNEKKKWNTKQILLSSFIFTWANPQAILDGTLLLGGIRAKLPSEQLNIFMYGIFTASIIWFFGVTYTFGKLNKLIKGFHLKLINIACGATLLLFGLKLGFLSIK